MSCRAALRQYESIVSNVIPAIAASEEAGHVQPAETWSQAQQEHAESALFDRLAREEKHPPGETGKRDSSVFPHRLLPFATESTWRHVWMLYAAGILLFCALSFFAYRVGMQRGIDVAKAPPAQIKKEETPSAQALLEEQLSDAGHDRAVVNTESLNATK